MRVVGKGTNEKGERIYLVGEYRGDKIVSLCLVELIDGGRTMRCMEHTGGCVHTQALLSYFEELQQSNVNWMMEIQPKKRKPNPQKKERIYLAIDPPPSPD